MALTRTLPRAQLVNGPSHPGAVGAPPAKITPPPPVVPGPPGHYGDHAPLSGWRDLLLERGPEGWAKAVRAHPHVLLTDTTMCGRFLCCTIAGDGPLFGGENRLLYVPSVS